MCDVGTAGLIITAIGTAASAKNAYDTNQVNAQIAENNAIVTRRAAFAKQQQGAIAASQQRERTRRLLSEADAAYASAGVDPSQGSPLDVKTGIASKGELDAVQIENNAALEVYGLKAQASFDETEARLARLKSIYGTGATLLTGAGSLLTQARQLGYKWAQ